MIRMYLRITPLIPGELNVARLNEDQLKSYVNEVCSEDEWEVTDWLQDVSVGDDISIYRDNNKACVIVRVQ